jgi:hypothetical protein
VNATFLRNLREMIHRPYPRATVFVVTLGFLIQISGINAIVYFTPLIFAKMGLTGYGAELLVPAGVQAAALAAFSIFLGLAALSLGFVWKFAPETKGRPLDSIPAFWRNGGRWDTLPAAVTDDPPATGQAA